MEQEAALETVIIFTKQMEALAEFYEQGLEIGPYEIAPGHLGCQVGPVYFGFDQVSSADRHYKPGAVTVWFTVADINAVFERLVSLGAEVRYPPTEKPWGARLASVLDPDGNILGLSQRRD